MVRAGGADTTPVAGARLTLHRVGRTVQGAIDSSETGAEGQFRFRLRADSAALYLVSARYAGLEYFGEPVRPPGESRVLILVSDTSSTAPVRLGARHVIVRPPDDAGTRAVLDLLSIRNDGPDTRVGADSLAPTWWVILPRGAVRTAVEEGEVSPTAVHFRGDTMFVVAPLAPGRKNVMVSYHLPLTVNRPGWTAPVDSFDLLVEEAGAEVHGAGLQPVAPVTLMGATLRRWTAAPPTGGPAEVSFAGNDAAQSRLLYGLVALLAGSLGLGAAVVFRRGRAGAADARSRKYADPIDDLARLDARYAAGSGGVPEGEWSAYLAERARLKAAALARRRPRS